MLAEDRAFDAAALRGDDLFGAAGEEIVRLPKAGGAVTTLARFPGREVRAFGLTAKHVVVATHEKDPEGVGVKRGTGKLVAIPMDGLDGGEPAELLGGFGASTEMAVVDDGVYFARDDPSTVVFYPAPLFKKPQQLAVREHIMFWGLAAESDGVEWLEEDFAKKSKALVGWTRSDGGGSVREIATTEGYGSTMRSDGRALYLIVTSSSSALAPGGGTYYEDQGSVVAIDRATGAQRVLAKGIDNPGDLALGPETICVTEYGPKLQFSKNSWLRAVPKAGGDLVRLATGLVRPSCLAADAQFFYVKEQGKKGIARVPVSAPVRADP
jgi:hypothetical protein